MTKAKTPRTNCGNCGNGAPALATNSCTNTLTMKAAKGAPKTANSSPRCSRMPTSASSIACCSGRSTASPEKAWSRPSCTCNGWLPTAWDSTVTQSRTWPPTTSLCAISCSPCWPRWPRSRPRRLANAPEPGWLEPRRRASASDAQASPLNYGSKSLSESRQAKHPMPSPKHSASTGTQQPNTADSQGPSGLDFIREFQCTNRFQKRQEHIMIRASGKPRHICHSCRKQLKQLFFFFHVAIMSRSSADLLVNKSVLFDPLKCLNKCVIRCDRPLNFRGFPDALERLDKRIIRCARA